MIDVTYISDWKPELCIHLEFGQNHKADFNRFLVKSLPSTKTLQQGGIFENADREGFVLQLRRRFSEILEEGGSHCTLYGIFTHISHYLRWCDKKNVPAFTQHSLEDYLSHLDNQVKLGLRKSSSYKSIHSRLITIFTKYLELPYSYFDNVVVRD